MALPRRVREGASWFLTRRCTQREFLLLPTRAVNEAFLYVLAESSQRFEMGVHAFCAMSNHFHLVVTDPLKRLPKFMHRMNGLLARCLNAYWGRAEAFWAPGSYSAVELEGAEALVEKVVYTLNNPVAAGLVSEGSEWPGMRSEPERMGGAPYRARRPKFFFGRKGRRRMADEVELRLVVPPEGKWVAGAETEGEYVEVVVERLDVAEEQVRAEFEKEGRKFFGRKAVMAAKPTDRPSEESAPESKGGLKPRLACRDRWKRVEALALLQGFVAEYREALRRYLAGEKDVEFPDGTYWMRERFGVKCRSP